MVEVEINIKEEEKKNNKSVIMRKILVLCGCRFSCDPAGETRKSMILFKLFHDFLGGQVIILTRDAPV
jgi:hypothetical protein